MGLIAVLFGILFFLGSALRLALRTQTRSRLLHPGVVLTSVLAFYALPCLFLVLLLPGSWMQVAPNLARHYHPESMVQVGSWYLAAGVGFFAAELFIRLFPSREIVIRRPSARSKPGYTLALAAAAALSLVLFYKNFGKVGGFGSVLSMDRSSAYDALSSGGGFTRYQFAVHAMLALCLTAHFGGIAPSKVFRRALALFFLGYCGISLINGTRLETVVVLLGALALIRVYRPGVVRENRRVLYILALVAAPLLFAYGSFREDVRRYFAGGSASDTTSISWEMVFPAESTTGYVPGLAMQEVGLAYGDRNVLADLFPRTIADALGVDKPLPLAAEVARAMRGIDGMVTYTTPLPISLAASGGVGIVLVGSFVVYLGVVFISRGLSNLGPLGYAAASILYMNLYYIIRVEPANWFPRIWQDLIVLFLCWIPVLLFDASRSIWRGSRARPLVSNANGAA